MSTKLNPLHDRVIVRRIEEGEQVRGGDILPDTAKEKPQEGVVLGARPGKRHGTRTTPAEEDVVAAGEGKYKEDGSGQALDVKAGDGVLLGKYSGSEIKIDGEE